MFRTRYRTLIVRTPLVIPLLAFWLCVIVVTLTSWGHTDENTLLAQPVAAAIITILAGCANTTLYKLGLTTASSMALLSYACFHLLEIVPVQMGLCDALYTRQGAQGFHRGVLLYILFVCGSQIGTGAGFLLFRRRRARPDTNSEHKPVWYTGLTLLAIGSCLFAFGIVQFGGFGLLFSQYGDFWLLMSTRDPRFFVTGMWAISSALLILLASASSRGQLKVAGASLAAYFLFTNAAGFRGAGFTLAMAVVVVIGMRRLLTRVWPVVLAGVFAAVMLVPFVKQFRSLTWQQRISADAIPSLDSFWNGPREIGLTFRAVTWAVELVPHRSDYWKGKSYLDAVQHVAPNVGIWRADVSDLTRDMRIGEWMTYVLDPTTWQTFGGLGTSGIAEPFINFGVIGVPLHFAVLFLALMWLDLRSRQSIKGIAIAACWIMPICWSARDDVFSVMRAGTWSTIVIVTGSVLFSRAARRRSCTPHPGTHRDACSLSARDFGKSLTPQEYK